MKSTSDNNRQLTKILIVGEQSLICNLLSRELSQEDYQVMTLTDAQSLWKKINRFHPELVLLDRELRTCDCWQLLREIKDKEPTLGVLVYVYTGLASIKKIKQAVEEVAPTKRLLAESNPNAPPIVKW
jgi:DNA-binding response OmpR family regulator